MRDYSSSPPPNTPMPFTTNKKEKPEATLEFVNQRETKIKQVLLRDITINILILFDDSE